MGPEAFRKIVSGLEDAKKGDRDSGDVGSL